MTAFWWAVGIMLVAALLVTVLVRDEQRAPDSARRDDAEDPNLPILTH